MVGDGEEADFFGRGHQLRCYRVDSGVEVVEGDLGDGPLDVGRLAHCRG